MNKIFLRVRGGLGNQLFQYSYAYALQKENPDYKIILDTKEFSKYYWPFQLDEFNLSNTEIYSDRKFKCDSSMKRFHLYQYIYGRLKKRTYRTSERLIKKGRLYTGTFSPEIRKYDGRDIYLYGYFQDAALLEPIRNELTEIFTLKEINEKVASYLDKIGENAVVVSVRVARQEELDNGEKFVYDGAEYYRKCIEYVKKKRGDVQIVVFSNNIERIRSEGWFDGIGQDILYIENCSATEQIEIMKKCRDFVLANSTFSWWGAYLGATGKDSVIIAPKIWYDGEDIDDTKLRFEGLQIFDTINGADKI